MDTKRVALVLSVIAIGLAPVAMAAPACNVRAKVPAAARTFAKTSEHDAWREYRSIEEVPEVELDGGMSAQFWRDKKNRSVYTIEPSQDFWTYTRYCFDSEGELEGASFEIRTPLGWGVRAEGAASSGGFDAHSWGFFSLKNGKAISRPAGVGDPPAALKPTLYRKVNELPFAGLLEASTSSKRNSKHGSAPNLARVGN